MFVEFCCLKRNKSHTTYTRFDGLLHSRSCRTSYYALKCVLDWQILLYARVGTRFRQNKTINSNLTGEKKRKKTTNEEILERIRYKFVFVPGTLLFRDILISTRLFRSFLGVYLKKASVFFF